MIAKRHCLIGCLLLLCISWCCAETSGWDIVHTAKKYNGCRYRYGANGPWTFDCSGFVRHCYAQNGFDLPRKSSQQALCGSYVMGNKDSLWAGDIVYFGFGTVKHVGIYIVARNGCHEFIHCSSSRGVTISTLEDDYWTIRYMGARRIVSAEGVCTEQEIVEQVGLVPITPRCETGAAPIMAETELGISPIPTVKHWKMKVKKNRRKTIQFADENTNE